METVANLAGGATVLLSVSLCLMQTFISISIIA